MKIINKTDNKFFGLKKKLISIPLIVYVFTKVFMFIVHYIVLLYPAGCQHSFVHNFLIVVLPAAVNMSFIHIPLLRPKTLPAVCADLVNP